MLLKATFQLMLLSAGIQSKCRQNCATLKRLLTTIIVTCTTCSEVCKNIDINDVLCFVVVVGFVVVVVVVCFFLETFNWPFFLCVNLRAIWIGRGGAADRQLKTHTHVQGYFFLKTGTHI